MKILLAVSGGIDSMYMANKASELFPEASFAIAHCNFALRGEESDGDEKFVKEWGAAHSVPVFAKRFDTSGYAEHNHISIEMAARELRYAWFAELCEKESFDAVAVAHNANDSAETLVLNLLRGTGSRGLRGIGADASVASARILRPLLGTSRCEIEKWMKENGCQWREDRTNSDNVYKRNIVRNEVFPVFERINPSYLNTIQGDMERFSQVDDIAADYYAECGLDPDSIDIEALKAKKHWRYLLFRLTEGRLNRFELESLCDCLESGRQIAGKEFGPYVCSAGHLVVREIREGDVCMVVEGPGKYDFNGHGICVCTYPAKELKNLKQPKGILIADASKLGFPFILRGWREGDWMQPLGMKGRKKLSDLFTDLKWGAQQKSAAVVAVYPAMDPEGNGRIAALLGQRIDDSLKVTDQTENIIEIRL